MWPWILYLLSRLKRIHSRDFLQNSYHRICHRSRSSTSARRCSSSFHWRATVDILRLHSSGISSRVWTLPSAWRASPNCCMVLNMLLFGRTWIWHICNPATPLMFPGTSTVGNSLLVADPRWVVVLHVLSFPFFLRFCAWNVFRRLRSQFMLAKLNNLLS